MKNLIYFFIFNTIFLTLGSYQAFAEDTKKTEELQNKQPASQEQVEKPKKDSELSLCLKTYTSNPTIASCIRLAYEKVESRREFLTEQMYDVISEQNFLPEHERKRLVQAKAKEVSNKVIRQDGSRMTKEDKMAEIFAVDEQDKVLIFEQRNASLRVEAVGFLRQSSEEFEKYRETECNRQRHFLMSDPSFASLVFYTCKYELTKERVETVKRSLR